MDARSVNNVKSTHKHIHTGCQMNQRGGDVVFKENLNAPRPSEHPPVRGENIKTFIRWDHRLQIQIISWVGSVIEQVELPHEQKNTRRISFLVQGLD